MRTKYGSKKIKVSGAIYDSRLEYYRSIYLDELQGKGVITDLQRQVRYEIIPACKPLRKAEYVADFVYVVDGKTVIEDVKSEATRKKESYILKKKLMNLRGTPIKEVFRASDPIR